MAPASASAEAPPRSGPPFNAAVRWRPRALPRKRRPRAAPLLDAAVRWRPRARPRSSRRLHRALEHLGPRVVTDRVEPALRVQPRSQVAVGGDDPLAVVER